MGQVQGPSSSLENMQKVQMPEHWHVLVRLWQSPELFLCIAFAWGPPLGTWEDHDSRRLLYQQRDWRFCQVLLRQDHTDLRRNVHGVAVEGLHEAVQATMERVSGNAKRIKRRSNFQQFRFLPVDEWRPKSRAAKAVKSFTVEITEFKDFILIYFLRRGLSDVFYYAWPSAFASPISISAESFEASAACTSMEVKLIWPGIFALGGGYGEGGAWDDIGHPFWSKIFGDMAGLLRAWSFELARSRPHLRYVHRSRRRQPREREWSNTIQDHVENGGGDGGGHLLYYFESLKIFGFIY